MSDIQDPGGPRPQSAANPGQRPSQPRSIDPLLGASGPKPAATDPESPRPSKLKTPRQRKPARPAIDRSRGPRRQQSQPAPQTNYDPTLDPRHPQFNDPFYDPDEWEPLRRTSPLIFRIGVVVAAATFSIIFAWTAARGWVDERLDPAGDPGDEIALTIPSGASADDIARILASEEIVSSSLVTSYYWRWNEAPVFQAGDYVFRLNSSVEEAQAVLEAGPLAPVFNGRRVVFPEGFTLEQIEGRMLDELDDFDPAEVAAALNDPQIRSGFQPSNVSSLEGFLFPATYEIQESELFDERALVQQMVNTFDERGRIVGLQNSQQAVGLDPYSVVTIASLIEREARLDEDRAKIARVIYNRLEQGMPLQIDATVIFALGDAFDFDEREGVVTFDDLEVDSPYNTYANSGLPPGPIAAPGEASLQAALLPAEGDWLFYVVIDEAGGHAFGATLDEHNRNIAQAEANGVR